MPITKEQIREAINDSLIKLYEKDSYLISHVIDNGINEKYSHVSERGIVFRFGIYLESIFSSHNESDITTLSIDTEYNRDLNNQKIIAAVPRGSYPDIIIHERGTNNNNILVVEFKPWWEINTNKIERDRIKIRDYTHGNGDYCYSYGILILLGKTFRTTALEWFQYGTPQDFEDLI